MPSYAVRCVALIAVAVLSASCTESSVPTLPSPPVAPPPTPAPAPTVEFPPNPTPFPGPGTYVFTPTPGVRVLYASGSRYVLDDDGSFALQFPAGGYRGTYTADGGRVTFEFEDGRGGGFWTAAGAFSGDAMTVKYNLNMLMSDFEDAVYARTR